MFENIENEQQEDLLQEWHVFKALCGEELLTIVTMANPSVKTSHKIIEMFTILGFGELQFYFITEFYFKHYGTTIRVKEDILPSLNMNNKKNNLINIFLDNIESEGLKDIFVKRADYFM